MARVVASTFGSLASRGFQDSEAASELLAKLGSSAAELTTALAVAADPDYALKMLVELNQQVNIAEQLAADEGTASRLVSVLGASTALAEHLVKFPQHWQDLADPNLGTTRPTAKFLQHRLLQAVAAVGEPEVSQLDFTAALVALRVEYRRLLMGLASRDLAQGLSMANVAAELSDLAAGVLSAALAIARSVTPDWEQARLSVIAMGKCGAHELNYVSDVDVIFVAEAAPGIAEDTALRVATQLASTVIRICGEHTTEGTIWPVDAGLRPEGKAGPLVRTLASHLSYYQRWAKTWEFQALLKASPIAGDVALGQQYCAEILPLIWQAASRPDFVTDVQAMRRRVLQHIPTAEVGRQLKLGAGGLRDVEFAVQLLQLVHGRSDESLRVSDTLGGISALTAGGYIGRDDGDSLYRAYEFLRKVEHRIQLYQLRRTHLLPEAEPDLRRLGRALGYFKDPVTRLNFDLRHHRREVSRLHEKIFYRPLLAAVARIPSADLRLSPAAATQRLAALGYLDPDAALRHLSALSQGVSRTAAIQRQLLPAMLQWFADAPAPDAGLFGFRRISESLGRTPWYLSMLRDEGQTAQRMAQVLATSRYATDLLEREPAGVQLLGEPTNLLALPELQPELDAIVKRGADAAQTVLALRGVRRRELLRISTVDITEPISVVKVGEALTDLTTAVLQASLTALVQNNPEVTRMLIVPMGRYGGAEMSYGSDADLIFVHEPNSEVDSKIATDTALKIANELRRLWALPATDPELEIDPDLRPEGRNGVLVRTLDSYANYYQKWSQTWESQALLRAGIGFGDGDLAAKFGQLIDPLRYPEAGLAEEQITEIRRLKARVDTERLPKGADPKFHFKFGRGGLADIEWTVQLLQLQFAGQHPELQTPQTITALHAARDLALLSETDAADLQLAWEWISKARNAVTLVRGKPAEQLPTDPRELAGVSHLLGFGVGESAEMVNEFQRLTRRASQVVARVFWGD